jgi:hypothetical protein
VKNVKGASTWVDIFSTLDVVGSLRVAIMLVLVSSLAPACIASTGEGAASPLPPEARAAADRFLATLVPRGETRRASRFTTEAMAAGIPDLSRTLSRAGVRSAERGVISRACGTEVSGVPVPGGKDCVVYRLFGKTREPRMVVENRAKLRLWMVKDGGGWRVATYDYHVHVRILPAGQPALHSAKPMTPAKSQQPFDIDEFVRELVADLRSTSSVYSHGELVGVEGTVAPFELDRYELGEENGQATVILWFRHTESGEVVRVVVHPERLAENVDEMPVFQADDRTRSDDTAYFAGTMLMEMLATREPGVTEMEL